VELFDHRKIIDARITMKVSLICLIFLCGFLHVRAQAGNANAFIDSVLTAVKTEYGTSLEPYHLPDETLAFNQKIGIITLKGDIKLTNGSLTGLSKIHRAGNATIGTEAGHFAVHLKVGDEKISFAYNAKVNFLDILHPNLQIEGDVAAIDINATIMLDSDGKPKISQFEIDELKHVRFHVHGLGILDPLVDLIADVAVEVANAQIRKALSHIVEGMVGSLLTSYKLPGTK